LAESSLQGLPSTYQRDHRPWLSAAKDSRNLITRVQAKRNLSSLPDGGFPTGELSQRERERRLATSVGASPSKGSLLRSIHVPSDGLKCKRATVMQHVAVERILAAQV
jgi:hypothetical protein